MRSWWTNLKGSGGLDFIHLLTIVTLATALIFGGGGAQGPLNNGLIVVLATVLLGAVLFAHFTGRRALPTIAVWPALLMVALMVLGMIQLSAVSNGPWLDAPGRAIEAQLLALFGEDAARPLSLDTEATHRALASFLLPLALLLSALGATRAQVRTYLLVIVIAAVTHAFVAVLQVGLGYPSHLNFYGGRTMPEPRGAFANSNHFGTMMTIGILAIAALSAMPRDPGTRRERSLKSILKNKSVWALLFFLPLFALLVAAANTRAGLFLILLSVPVALIATLRLKVSLKLPLLLLAAPLLLLTASAISPQIQFLAIGGRLWDPEDVRFAIWPDLQYIIESFGVWGTGLGGFDGAFRASENLDLVGPFYINHAHNDWIEWVMETGLPGTLLLVLTLITVIVLAIRAWIRSRHGPGLDRYLILISATALIAVGIHSIVDYPIRMAAISSCLAIFIAVLWLGWTEERPAAKPAGKWASWAIGIASLFVVAALSVHSVRIFAAEAAFVEGRPAAAVALNPRHGEALAAIAGRTDPTEEGAPQRIISTARRAILERPYTAKAVRSLAVALEAQGEPLNAAWPLAAALGWRDAPTQRWAFLQALEVGQFDVAALRADALMRTDNVPDNFDQTLWQLGLVPEFRAALIDRLALNPRWRERWLAAGPSADDRAISGAIAIIDALAERGPLTRYELRGTLQRLVASGLADEALRLSQIMPDDSEMAGLIDDGGFDRDPELYQRRMTPFDWNLRTGNGYLAQVEGRANPRAYIESDGQNGYPLIDRLMGLSPGNYAIEFDVERVNGDVAAFSATTICLGSNAPLATMRLDEGRNSLAFSVPDGCPITALALTSRVSDDYAGALLDNFALQRSN